MFLCAATMFSVEVSLFVDPRCEWASEGRAPGRDRLRGADGLTVFRLVPA